MRWLVFFLIVLNGLTFAWFTFQHQQQSQLDAREVEDEQFNFDTVPSLTLLSEMPAAEREKRDIRKVIKPMQPVDLNVGTQVTDMDEAPAEDDGSQPASVPECVVIGSYPEVISARQAKLTLQEKGIASDIVEMVKKLPAISWVYIPPLPDRKAALAVLKELQSKNIDSFLVSEGEYENAISLGFFSNRDSAMEIINERREQGYNAQVTMRERERSAYWVAVKEKTDLLTESQIEQLSADGKPVKMQEISCAEVALLKVIH